MPHQCTNCQTTFPDGSKEMLSGCPECGGNTFQYIPEGANPETYERDETPPDRPVSEDSVTGKVGRAASTVREYVNSRDEEPTEKPKSDAEPAAASDADTLSSEETGAEDSAQASARGEIADVSDLPSGADTPTVPPSELGADDTEAADTSQGGPPRDDGQVVGEPDPEAANTDLEDLRAELNDQFESIRIVEPGQYELNLMELYDREEHIVALQEDGKYVIEVPETWREGSDTPDRS